MGYAVELSFDKISENKMIKYWEELYRKSISSHMYESGSRPHIALAVFNDNIKEVNALNEYVQMYFNNMNKFKILFSSIGLFPTDEGVSFLSPKVTIDLLQLHEGFYKSIYNNVDLRDNYWGYYKPDVWVPHCTMTINNDRAMQIRGVDLISRKFETIEATVESVSLLKFYPANQMTEIKLK